MEEVKRTHKVILLVEKLRETCADIAELDSGVRSSIQSLELTIAALEPHKLEYSLTYAKRIAPHVGIIRSKILEANIQLNALHLSLRGLE